MRLLDIYVSLGNIFLSWISWYPIFNSIVRFVINDETHMFLEDKFRNYFLDIFFFLSTLYFAADVSFLFSLLDDNRA